MRITFKLEAKEWIFARMFAYKDYALKPYPYQSHFFGRKKKHEPKEKTSVPYLVVDEHGIMVNQNNRKGEWLVWEWDEIKSVRIYNLMHPWKASIFDWRHEADLYRERRKTKRYLRHMKWKYKQFPYDYREEYQEEYALLLEGNWKNGQFWIPKSWMQNQQFSWLMENIEKHINKEVIYFNTEERWNRHIQ